MKLPWNQHQKMNVSSVQENRNENILNSRTEQEKIFKIKTTRND